MSRSVGTRRPHSPEHIKAITASRNSEAQRAANPRRSTTQLGLIWPYWLRTVGWRDPAERRLHDRVKELVETQLCVRCASGTLRITRLDAAAKTGRAVCSLCGRQHRWAIKGTKTRLELN